MNKREDSTLLLATDLDGTLFGTDSNRIQDARHVRTLQQLILEHKTTVVYATGRSFPGAYAAVASRGLPEPHYWVCDLGCNIHTRSGELLPAWREIVSVEDTSLDWDQAIAEVLRCGCIELEDSHFARRSFRYAMESTLRVRNHVARMSGLRCIFTEHENEVTGILDLTPTVCGKWNAIQQVVQLIGAHVPVLYCGDSENDLDALTNASFPVVMPNAAPSLVRHFCGGSKSYYSPRTPGLEGILMALEYWNLP